MWGEERLDVDVLGEGGEAELEQLERQGPLGCLRQGRGGENGSQGKGGARTGWRGEEGGGGERMGRRGEEGKECVRGERKGENGSAGRGCKRMNPTSL